LVFYDAANDIVLHQRLPNLMEFSFVSHDEVNNLCKVMRRLEGETVNPKRDSRAEPQTILELDILVLLLAENRQNFPIISSGICQRGCHIVSSFMNFQLTH